MTKTKSSSSVVSLRFVVVYRLFFAALTAVAIVTQVQQNIDNGIFNPANFFSFFTVQSNTLVAVVFIAGAFVAIKGKTSKVFDLFRGAAALYMTITGIIFAALLSGLQQEVQTTVPWVNTVLHYVMPIVAVADWLLVRPERIPFKRALVWIALPLAYLPYSLVRGELTGWYPYPFLNPSRSGGYIGVLGYAICIAAVTLGLIWVLTRVKKDGIKT